MTTRERPRKALITVTSHDRLGETGKRTGWYLSEVTHLYYPLLEAGFQVDFASPRGGEAPMDEGSRKLDDPDNARFLADPSTMAGIRATQPLAHIEPSQYDVVHFAGGHGVMWDFPSDPDVQRIAAAIYEQGGIVAAVCHGPAALVNVLLSDGKYLVAGKEVAAFTNAEEREVGLADVVPMLLQSALEARGARVLVGPSWRSHVRVAERLVTGQNPQSAHEVAKSVLALARTANRSGA
jgi:putative intracellular protease/amidase